MKKFLASTTVALLSLPVAAFACGGGDCSGMELPPPPVPAPPHPQVDALLSSLSQHLGFFISLGLAAAIGLVIARRPKLLATKTAVALGTPNV
ncbi:MAG: hypothetical protein M3Y80_10505 [Verrucomicrobiota bacterium]|nr:hypothetical protein [Verrucomicrobiota bacterium]